MERDRKIILCYGHLPPTMWPVNHRGSSSEKEVDDQERQGEKKKKTLKLF